jgi:SAM-dependent methyltransferase
MNATTWKVEGSPTLEEKNNGGKHVCPWWVGYLLASPLRKIIQNPDDILAEYLKPGMKVLDLGCAMGFFTLPAARLIGGEGKVFAVDLQERMLRPLRHRARRRGLADRIETRRCPADTFAVGDLTGRIDFALLIDVIHEVPDPRHAFAEVYAALKPGGRILFVEPLGHVKEQEFTESLLAALAAGFVAAGRPRIRRSHAAILSRD